MEQWGMWIILAIIFAVAELLTPSFFFLWFAIGSSISAITSIFVESITINIILFLITSFLLWISTRKIVKKLYKSGDKRNLYQEELNGKKGSVILVNKDEEYILVKVEGEEWKAHCDEINKMKIGDKVEVIKRESNILKVKKEEM
ncbi:protease [Tepiditoga spiralis]|uniref:Protease n=1 Tax=Tepiditoga spiralis TaxID=2108365 RepID=A0A7G1G816_9BACT|nr:NfeD family protein [Tepiditoga spiralis]BBE31354.1 protease [Tepiditoga spiralis]